MYGFIFLIKLILISVRIGMCLHIFREKERMCVCASRERELVLFSFTYISQFSYCRVRLWDPMNMSYHSAYHLGSVFKIHSESDYFPPFQAHPGLSHHHSLQDYSNSHLAVLISSTLNPLAYRMFSIQHPKWVFQCFSDHFTPPQKFLISELRTKYLEWS